MGSIRGEGEKGNQKRAGKEEGEWRGDYSDEGIQCFDTQKWTRINLQQDMTPFPFELRLFQLLTIFLDYD